MTHEELTPDEVTMRLALARASFENWPTDELWNEYVLLVDEGAQGDKLAEAKSEAIGLALIGRGATAADLRRGAPYGGGV